MAGYTKDELRRDFQIAQTNSLLRDGKGVVQDFTFVSNEDIAELALAGQRLAKENEPAELLYLDDTRCVRVCAISAEPAQIAVAAEGTRRDRAQNHAPATTPQRQTIAVPVLARA